LERYFIRHSVVRVQISPNQPEYAPEACAYRFYSRSAADDRIVRTACHGFHAARPSLRPLCMNPIVRPSGVP
jgi:hypothetical protein